MKCMKIIAIAIIVLLACTSCITTTSSVVSDFYVELISPESISSDRLLQDEEEPSIIHSADISTDVYSLLSNYYVIMGVASYNGTANSSLYDEINDFCKEKGAPVAVYAYNSVEPTSAISDVTEFSIYTHVVQRYDYVVFLLAPESPDLIKYYMRIGLHFADMDTAARLSSKQNTGAYVDIVYENSPAFYANIFPGDIVVSVNGKAVYDSDSFYRILNNSKYGDRLKITLIRDGSPYSVSLTPLY